MFPWLKHKAMEVESMDFGGLILRAAWMMLSLCLGSVSNADAKLH